MSGYGALLWKLSGLTLPLREGDRLCRGGDGGTGAASDAQPAGCDNVHHRGSSTELAGGMLAGNSRGEEPWELLTLRSVGPAY